MDFLKAIILGAIEGITEFLPISSTAHLIVGEKLLSFDDTSAIFTVVVQFGAILAALVYFWGEIVDLVKKALRGDYEARRFGLMVLIGLVPAGVVGFVLELTVGIPDALALIGASLFFGGLVLLLTEKYIDRLPIDKEPHVDYKALTTRRALSIGMAQCLAIVPGVSRSGATIVSGLLVGVNRPTATAFSFYLSIPIMLAASLLKLVKDYDQISSISGGVAVLIVGTATSFLTAFLVVKWLLRYVQKHDFKPFAYYRMAVGLTILLWALRG